MNKNLHVFFDLLKAGLWEKDVQLLPYGDIDFTAVKRSAMDQSVLGLVAAGVEHVRDTKVAKRDVLPIIGQTYQIEQRNAAMNLFIAELTDKIRKAGISSVLVKGQGIAQCYERPLWRSSGDVDLLLDAENYKKAKDYLIPLASVVNNEDKGRLHIGITIGRWLVELHGTLHANHHLQMDRLLDEVQREVLQFGKVRVWRNDSVDVLLPAPDEDVIFVFAHILQHFFKGGIGLRQICDWCRLLWTYHSEIDMKLLAARLSRMGMMSKWKAFAAFAVYYLGMPVDAMPLFSYENKWKKKAGCIWALIKESGNFGHGRDQSYKENHSDFVANIISFGLYTKYNLMQSLIFPIDAVKGWYATVLNGIKARIVRMKEKKN